MAFTKGTTVQIAKDAGIPIRYQGRTGVVAGRTKVGRGFRYNVYPVGGRRATPLTLSKTQITVL